MREDYVRFLEETNPHDDGWDIDKARVVAYYGNYSGCEIAYMDCFQAYTQAIRSVEVAGYSLTFGNGQELYAYRDSQFYTIQKAYDAGLLTKQDVYNIGTKVGLIIEANNTD